VWLWTENDGRTENKKTLDIHWIILCYWIRYASFKQTHHGEALSRQVSGGPIVPEGQRHGSEKKKKRGFRRKCAVKDQCEVG